jgi:ligand-binding sensor domain-containing protein/signal transduction histidine kinase
MRKLSKSLSLFFFFFSFVLQAQRYSFIEFSTAEGLPQSQVSAIIQDQDGYLWTGSFGGVSKFNGKSFINFGKNNGLLTNVVTSLSIIEGRLYIGHDNGISIKSKIDTFQTIKFPNTAGIANTTAICEYEDEVFVATNGLGLFKLLNNKMVPVKGSPERIRFMKIAPSGEIYLATREGIIVYNGKKFVQHKKFPEGTYSDIHIHQDTIYASTFDGFVYKLVNEKLTVLYDNAETPIRKIYIDKKGDLWLNSRFGVLKLGENIIEINEDSGLPMNDVNLIFQDREENIWLGTGGRGLLKFCGETFLHYNKVNGLPSELIISIIENQNEKLVLSSFDKGVFQVSMVESAIKATSIDYIRSTVWSTAKNSNQLFFGSLFGLYINEDNSWKVMRSKDGLPGDKITGLKANKNKVYIGTSEGVAVYEDYQLVDLLENNNEILSARDFAFTDSTIYVGARAGLYEIKNGKIKSFTDFDGGVNSIVIDENNVLWVGTESGLHYNKNGSFEAFQLDESGRADYINFLVSADQSIFIGTNNGLFEYDIKNEKKYQYGINSGLVDLETNLNSAFVDKNNNLWFGTVAGLMKMTLNNRIFQRREIKPLLNVTSASINFKSVTPFLFKNEAVELKYTENNLLFEFDGIFLTNPKQIQYRYFLEGFSDDWSPLSNSNSFNFTNLNPGTYTLKVQAVLMGEVFSETLELKFIISPPFYQTIWFYALLFLLLASIVFFLDRLRTQRIKRKNYQLNLEVKSKLIELEQQSLNASMNRHFIFNALNSIQYYINSADTKSANRYLTRFAKLIRKNLDSSHSKNGMVSLTDELERLELYLDIESMRFKDKFDYSITVDPKVEAEALKVPAMFLQPFVENSIIHGVLSLKDRKGQISISVTDHFDHIRIEVIDNGIGIDNSLKSKKDIEGDHLCRGVKITKGRIELLQKISARSIELIGPIQINENDHSIKGTKVTFKILKQFLENE